VYYVKALKGGQIELGNGGLISGAFAEQSAHSGGIDLSAKGDMHGYSDDDARIPISTNNFSLLCDSAQSLGLKWAASPTSLLSAAGDILYASGANTLAKLAKGDDDKVLTLKSGIPSWESAAGGGSLELLDADVIASDTALMTFTPASALTEEAYSAILVVFTGAPKTDDATLGLEINNLTSNYQIDGLTSSGGTVAGVDLNAQSEWQIGAATHADRTVQVQVMIQMADSSITTDYGSCTGTMSGGAGVYYSFAGRNTTGNVNSITEIEIGFSSGDIADGSKMTTYGLKRT